MLYFLVATEIVNLDNEKYNNYNTFCPIVTQF